MLEFGFLYYSFEKAFSPDPTAPWQGTDSYSRVVAPDKAEPKHYPKGLSHEMQVPILSAL